MSSLDVDGGGGVSSNQGGGGLIGYQWTCSTPPCDGGTCMGGDGNCGGVSAGVSCLVGIHGVSGS